jgi:hypothetical protein
MHSVAPMSSFVAKKLFQHFREAKSDTDQFNLQQEKKKFLNCRLEVILIK